MPQLLSPGLLAATLFLISSVTDRFAALEAEALNVQVDYPLFEQLARPVTTGKTRVPGIKISLRLAKRAAFSIQ